jgi:hypothetical protein
MLKFARLFPAQKSGRNAVAFEADRSKLEELEEKAAMISSHHDKKFRSDIDGNILKL